MNRTALLMSLAALLTLAFKSDKPAYLIYDSEGRNMKYQKMIETIGNADVIFFGELHDNPISHWLEFEITADLYKVAGNNLVIGAEMFEADNQLLLDEYLGVADFGAHGSGAGRSGGPGPHGPGFYRRPGQGGPGTYQR